MIKSSLRWGYLFGIFSFFALIVAFFLYGQNIALPDGSGVTLFYRAGFIFATPLVDFLQIESLFTYILLAGFFQVAVAFCLGVSAGFLYHLSRQ